MRLALHKLRRRFGAALWRAIEGVIIVAIVVGGGLGSSWYMVEAGSIFTTTKVGPWKSWTWAARADADPYTRAHFVNAGMLTVSSQVQRTFVAHFDEAGSRLHSSCDYTIEGALKGADWWSIAVFDDGGKLIPNAADRYSFTSQTIVPGQAGRFAITLAREARTGNWLPTGGAGRLALVLNITDAHDAKGPPDQGLPVIKKVKCR